MIVDLTAHAEKNAELDCSQKRKGEKKAAKIKFATYDMSHEFDLLANLPKYAGPDSPKAQLRCQICSNKASLYCVTCTAKQGGKIVAVCSTSAKGGCRCINMHLQHGREYARNKGD